MKKKIQGCFILLAILLMGIGCDESNFYDVTIKNGTSFGLSADYSIREVIIDSENITFSKRGFDERNTPEISFQEKFSSDKFHELFELINLQEFNKLPDYIGCPDCYDQGAEWVELSVPEYSKRVTFSYDEIIPEIEEFVNKLREIRNSYN